MLQDLDVDDVGALCAAHALADLGEAEILAVGETLEAVVKVLLPVVQDQDLLVFLSLLVFILRAVIPPVMALVFVPPSVFVRFLSAPSVVPGSLILIMRKSLPKIKPEAVVLEAFKAVVWCVPIAEYVSTMVPVSVLRLPGTEARD